MLGKLLDGRYLVVQVLGTGGFGQTYIAQDTRRPGNPVCVVKHLKPASSDPNILPTARRLFNSEAETLEQLGNHDQIPRLLAYFEQEQEFYLVQELIEGHTLKTELSPGSRWTENQVIPMLQDVLGILEFVHSRGVIHRDIKPDNLIRRTSDNKLVLVDFGAVKQLPNQMVGIPSEASATVAIGTPGYMPSEQARGQPRPNSDIYALGIIAIQSLTGILPLQLQEDPNTGEMLWQHLVSVSPGLAAVLNKMVRYHFKDRYQTATEALQAITQINNYYLPTQQYSNYPGNAPTVYPGTPQNLPRQPVTPPPTQHTIPASPVNFSRPPVNPQTSYTPPYRSNKMPLIFGTTITAAVVAAVGVGMGYAFRQSPFQLGSLINQPENTQQASCSVVIDSLNVRSGSSKNSNIIGTVEQGTNLYLTGNKQNGWVEINSPVKGWVFSGSQFVNCGSASETPTQTQPEIPKISSNKPRPVSEDKSANILDQATNKFQSGDINGAIALAKSIPFSSSNYQETIKTVKRWRQEWEIAQDKFNQASQAFEQGRWEEVLVLTKDAEFPDIKYWKDRLQNLAKEAEKNQKDETPNPTPTPSPSDSPSPQPSPTDSPTPTPSSSPQEKTTTKSKS
ncbi:serine/threonine protein kinase [Crinalium epipsammum PCC 9333]|uniref:non-specific serine/threonine protein kinase n=1 Tax=Crinalium epipsammum PCC 9333 TaxID=1173022 RepID=K9W4E3_9CYAN|nr:protein kinase [Crinalium epipsammum]AFZ15228.1 serine/threonine protein kinase [Crinalium epipsammum PCC 9333]